MKIIKLTENKKLNEKITEDSQVFKDMSSALDDIEYLCQDTYNWDTEEWNDKENIKRTAEQIIDRANTILDCLRRY